MPHSGKKRILFLCTGNSCRSQIAEAILRHVGAERFEAFSAGSHPAGYVHALATGALQQLRIPIDDFVSKSWDEYATRSFDAVITLCDAAAAETCPTFPGKPIHAHWSTLDPVQQPGTEMDRLVFAIEVATRLKAKIDVLTQLDWTLPRAQLQNQLQDIAPL
jgi:arsenate reductase